MADSVRNPKRARSGVRRVGTPGVVRSSARRGRHRSRSTLSDDRSCVSRAHARVARARGPGARARRRLTFDRSASTDRSRRHPVQGIRGTSERKTSLVRFRPGRSGDDTSHESGSGEVFHRNHHGISRTVHRSIHNMLGFTSCLTTSSGVKWTPSLTGRAERLHAQRPIPIDSVSSRRFGELLGRGTGGSLQAGVRHRILGRSTRQKPFPAVGGMGSADAGNAGTI